MKFAFVVAAGVAVLTAGAANADVAEGEALFQARCNMCHGAGLGGAPLMDKLAALDPAVVVEKMTTGTMAPMSAGISDANKRDIAVFVTKKPLPAAGNLPAVAP